MKYLSCPDCGSYQDECQCDARHEYQLAMRALGMDIEPTYGDYAKATRVQVETDLAAFRQALREYGY